MKTYRSGAVGALMDEYERAVGELYQVIEPLSEEAYDRVRDPHTEDESCRSIATIVSHVVGAGYGYAGMLRNAWGRERMPRERVPVPHAEAEAELAAMVVYTIATLEGKWDLSDEEANAMHIPARWGPVYDFEQLFEHAIVHVMRHRRQIERFLNQ